MNEESKKFEVPANVIKHPLLDDECPTHEEATYLCDPRGCILSEGELTLTEDGDIREVAS